MTRFKRFKILKGMALFTVNNVKYVQTYIHTVPYKVWRDPFHTNSQNVCIRLDKGTDLEWGLEIIICVLHTRQ